MLCKTVLPLLSEYFDGVLDADTAIQVSQHLDQCIGCRREYKSLSALHAKLSSFRGIQAPEYLQDLVQHRISEMKRDTWRSRIQNELELRWSRIRTTEVTWYWTRALGTIMTTVFFLLISSTISPQYVGVNPYAVERAPLTPSYHQQVGQSLLMKFGMMPARAPKKRTAPIKPAINDLYLVHFAQKNSQDGKEDSLAVVTEVDQSGAPKVQNILEYPEDSNLLDSFAEMITSARFRPASKDGETVPSHMVFLFNQISVSD